MNLRIKYLQIFTFTRIYSPVNLLLVDSVEGPDILVVVEGGDEGDDVPLNDVLSLPTQHSGTESILL